MAIQPKNTNTIAVDVITEKAAAAGVTIDGVLIKDNFIQGNGADFAVSIRGANDSYLRARNAANSADLSLLKADGTDNTVLNAGTSKQISFAINNVVKTIVNSSGNLAPVSDASQDIGTSGTNFNAVYGRSFQRTSAGDMTVQSTLGALILNSQGASQEVQVYTQGLPRWRTDSVRMFPGAHNTYDIGVASTNEVRTIYCATQVARASAGNIFFGAAAGSAILSGSTSADLAISGSTRWSAVSSGNFVPATTNTYDIGTSSVKVKSIYTSDVRGSAGAPVYFFGSSKLLGIDASGNMICTGTVETAAGKTDAGEYLTFYVNGNLRYIRLYQ